MAGSRQGVYTGCEASLPSQDESRSFKTERKSIIFGILSSWQLSPFTLYSLKNPNGDTMEKTLSIIKPDCVAKNVMGKILSRFEDAGLKIVAAKMMHLSKSEAMEFYKIHKERPFFNDLVTSMISGPVLVIVLEGANPVLKNRD